MQPVIQVGGGFIYAATGQFVPAAFNGSGDGVIASGALTYRALFGRMHGRPTMPSKLNTVCQVTFALAVVAQVAYGWPRDWAIDALGALTLVSTFVSGLDYVLIYSRRAAGVVRARRVEAAGR